MRCSSVLAVSIWLLVAVCRGDEVIESRGFFKKLVDKTKNGLGKARRSLSATKDKGAPGSENPLGEGVGAVLDAIDELVAEGQATAGKATKDAKEVVDNTKESVKETLAASKEKLSAASADVKSTMDAAVEDAAAEVDAIKGAINDFGGKLGSSAEAAAESAAAASKEAQEAAEKEADKAAEKAAETANDAAEMVDEAAKTADEAFDAAATKATEEL